MNTTDDLKASITRADPLAGRGDDGAAHSPAARALLQRIMATPRDPQPARPTRPASRRRWALAVAGAAAMVLVAALAIWPGIGAAPALAATPPLLSSSTTKSAAGAPVLERIAAAAEALPPEPVTGPYRYARTEQWGLNTTIMYRATIAALASSQSESWLTPQGVGRYRTANGQNLVNHVSSQKTLDAALRKPSLYENTFTAANPRPLADPDQLRYEDPEAFALSVDPLITASLPPSILLVEAIDTLYANQPVPPQVRAKVWRLLATVPGVTTNGSIEDRAGRSGTVITIPDDGSAHGLAGRLELVIDPASGQLLEYDDVITEANELTGDVPAVLSLSVYLDRGYTKRPQGRPQR